MPNLFIGTSGWAYPSWKPGFYPEKLAQTKFLTYYATQLNTVEVNLTFPAAQGHDRTEVDRTDTTGVSVHHQSSSGHHSHQAVEE